jgi:hypothetical protein
MSVQKAGSLLLNYRIADHEKRIEEVEKKCKQVVAEKYDWLEGIFFKLSSFKSSLKNRSSD